MRTDLVPGQQAVQACHVAIQFGQDHPEVYSKWFETSNTLAMLATPNEESLGTLLREARAFGLLVSEFREPDIGNALTAIALEPGPLSKKLTSRLPLALK